MTKFWAAILLLAGSAQAQPLRQLLRDYRHDQALPRIERRLTRATGTERRQLNLLRVLCLLELDRLQEAQKHLQELPAQGALYFLVRGQLARRQNQDDLARGNFEHILTLPGNLPEQVSAALELATLEAQAGHSSECDAYFSRAVQVADQLPEQDVNWLRFYGLRATQLESTGRLQEGLDQARLGYRLCEKVRPGSSSPLLTLQAHLLVKLQRYAEADSCWERVLRQTPSSSGPLLSWGYSVMYQRSDPDAPKRWLAASQRPIPAQWTRYERFHLLLLRSQAYLFRLHDPVRAESDLIRAEPLASRQPHLGQRGMRINLAFHQFGPTDTSELSWVVWMRLLALQRRQAPAPDILRFMRSRLERIPQNEQGPWLYQLSKLEEPAAARSTLDRALQVSTGLQRIKILVAVLEGPHARPEDGALWTSALAALEPKERKQAQDALLESAAEARFDSATLLLWDRPDGPPHQPLHRLALATIADGYDGAPDLAQMTLLEQRKERRSLIESLARESRILHLQGRTAEALAVAYRALDLAEQGSVETSRSAVKYQLACLHAARGEFSQALPLIEAVRQERVAQKERESEASAARAQRAIQKWAQAAASPPPSADLQTLTAPEFLRQLGGSSELATSVPVLPSRLVEMAAQLPEGEVLVQYHLAAHEATLMVARRSGFQVLRRRLDRSQVESWIAQLRRQILRGPQPETANRMLYALLLEPLQLQDQRVTLICPGLLQDMPWDLLVDSRGQWWSARWSLWAGEARQQFGSRPQPHMAALGGVQGLDLPGSLREVEQLAARFPGQVDLLTGAAATRAALENLAPSCDVLHLATHAGLATTPQQAHLSLADGNWTANRIYLCPLRPGALVVLSSCDSANTRGQERAPTTLASAFLAAGASQVIATLAPVEDDQAEQLLGSFYAQLQTGADPVTALQRAKAQLRDQTPTGSWAAFVLLGGAAPR